MRCVDARGYRAHTAVLKPLDWRVIEWACRRSMICAGFVCFRAHRGGCGPEPTAGTTSLRDVRVLVCALLYSAYVRINPRCLVISYGPH